jgi:hypothetical protein
MLHPTKRRDIYLCIGAIAFANFLLFLTVSQFLGGSAPNGYTRNGRFYLGEHGRYTQVSSAVYRYSQIHTWTTFALMFIGVPCFARGMSLRRELEEFDPITARDSLAERQ